MTSDGQIKIGSVRHPSFLEEKILDIQEKNRILTLTMTTETIKIQVTITRKLADALRLAAQKDRRSRPTFIVKLLEESSLVKECLLLVPEPVRAPSLLDATIPSENSSKITAPVYTPSVSPVGPVTLPDGTVCDDPYGLNDEPAPQS